MVLAGVAVRGREGGWGVCTEWGRISALQDEANPEATGGRTTVGMYLMPLKNG